MSNFNRTNARMNVLVAAEEGRLKVKNYGYVDTLAGMGTGVSHSPFVWAKRHALIRSAVEAPRTGQDEPVIRPYELTDAGAGLLARWREQG